MSKGELGRVFHDGEIIVRQGDTGDCMYVIQEGRAEVVVESDGKEIPLRVLGKGDFVGEVSIFEREVRSATVRAVGEARLITVDRKGLLRRIHEDPTLAFKIVETLAHRVRELSNELARLKARGSAGP